MNLNLHRNARLTPAIRQELRASIKSECELARECNLNRATVRKWRRRETSQDASHRPHRIHTTLSPVQEQVVVALYWRLFERAPDAAGLDYWLGQLRRGALTRNQLIVALIEGAWANLEAERERARLTERVRLSLDFVEEQRAQGIVYSRLGAAAQERLLADSADLLHGLDGNCLMYQQTRARLPDLVRALGR